MKTISRAHTVSFTTKGQVVIPSVLRKEFQIEDGTKAVLTATSEGILLKPVTAYTIGRMHGILKRKPGAKSFAEEWAEHKKAEHKKEERALEDAKLGRSRSR